jgi:hypothetical protein
LQQLFRNCRKNASNFVHRRDFAGAVSDRGCETRLSRYAAWPVGTIDGVARRQRISMLLRLPPFSGE